MFIRRDSRKLADDTVVTYLSIAHNVWQEGKTGKKGPKPVIMARLGREDQLDLGQVRGIRDAFDRYLQRRLREAGLPEEPLEVDREKEAEALATHTRAKQPELRMLVSRAYGMRAIVEPIWEALGLKQLLGQFAVEHKLGFELERVVFGLVLNRLVDPRSKRACNEWLKNEAYFPEAQSWQVQHFYRALDVLEAHADELSAHLMQGVFKRLPPDELTMLLVDTTSTYTETDFDDVQRAEVAADWERHDRGEGPAPLMPRPKGLNKPALRMRGHSKDKRSSEPQVVLGLVTGRSGRVLGHHVFAGNTNDQSAFADLVNTTLPHAPDGDVVVVADSGFAGSPNMTAVARADVHSITSVGKRRNKHVKTLLSQPGRWKRHPSKEHFSYRTMRVDADDSSSGQAELWVATRNQLDADRQKRKLDKDVDRVRAELEKDNRVDAHGHPICRLLSKPKLKRLVKKNKRGTRLLLDRKAVALERRRAGLKVVRCTLVDHDPIAVLEAYEGLLAVENDFRNLKGPLKLRPMYHRSATRIRAHVLVCILSLVVLQELEARSGWTLRAIRDAVSSVRANLMRQGSTEFWMRSEWPEEAKQLLDLLGQDEGARSWGSRQVEGDSAASRSSRKPEGETN